MQRAGAGAACGGDNKGSSTNTTTAGGGASTSAGGGAATTAAGGATTTGAAAKGGTVTIALTDVFSGYNQGTSAENVVSNQWVTNQVIPSFVYFDERDVVRHRLVQAVIKAYEAYGASQVPPK